MNRALPACALSFALGFLSLSQEILFVRLAGFAFESTPSAFAFVLVFFLLGVALGANFGKRRCAAGGDLWKTAGRILLAAACLDLLVPQLAMATLPTLWGAPALALLVLMTAWFKSALFPIAHELGSVSLGPRIGASMSRVYAANIAGSTLGPLATGFILLDVMPLDRAFQFIGVGTLLVAAACMAHASRPAALATGTAALGAGALALLMPPQLLPGLIRPTLGENQALGPIIETRGGIVHTITAEGGEQIFGGNVYDGRINTDLRVNSNGINRAYILAALHPNPKRILVLGLSGGSWARVLSQFPGVEKIDAVEINRGYIELINNHPEVSPILSDPRISIEIDDARRWLSRHPEARYDMIVMNTTFHWRAYITNLVSVEFLRLAQRHLNAGGIMTYNSTYSPDVVWTAREVFPFVRRYENFVYAANHDFLADMHSRVDRIWAIGDPGRPPRLSPDQAADRGAVATMLRAPFDPPARIIRGLGRPPVVITDDNMASEWRYGRRMLLFTDFDK